MLEFSLDLKEEPVVLVKGGERKEYVLREMTGKQRDQYLNSLNKRMKVDPNGGKSSISTFDGLQAELLSRCMFDSSGESVTLDVLQEFPANTQTKLFEAAQALNGLDADEDKEGNS